MENVKGMVNWEKGKAIEAIMNEISKPIFFKDTQYSYEINIAVLNAADYGAPQFRERVFLVGNRMGKKFQFPKPTHCKQSNGTIDLFNQKKKPYTTVWDAIGELPPADEPSETALRVSKTIKERIVKHGY